MGFNSGFKGLIQVENVRSKELCFRLQLYVHQYYKLYTYELASIIFVTKGRLLNT